MSSAKVVRKSDGQILVEELKSPYRMAGRFVYDTDDDGVERTRLVVEKPDSIEIVED